MVDINIKYSVTQLYDMMDLSDGVMLLGESYGGKTKSIKILAASLQAAQGSSGKAPTCVILNPKAIKIDQLYGYFNDDEWKDGILATCFRNFAGFSENVSIYIQVIFSLKSTQYKKLVPNALRFTYQNLKSCKPHENNNKKIHQIENLFVKN